MWESISLFWQTFISDTVNVSILTALCLMSAVLILYGALVRPIASLCRFGNTKTSFIPVADKVVAFALCAAIVFTITPHFLDFSKEETLAEPFIPVRSTDITVSSVGGGYHKSDVWQVAENQYIVSGYFLTNMYTTVSSYVRVTLTAPLSILSYDDTTRCLVQISSTQIETDSSSVNQPNDHELVVQASTASYDLFVVVCYYSIKIEVIRNV